MITVNQLTECMAVAERFLSCAQDARKRLAVDNKECNDRLKGHLPLGTYTMTSKQNGAVRRASMDLTRALADLRR
jgi:hypothetical protein